MVTITFTCTGLKKRTCPCCEGGKVAEALGCDPGDHDCYCGKFVGNMQRARGLPRHHTCIRDAKGLGRIYAAVETPGVLRVEIRTPEMPEWERINAARGYLEGRHKGVAHSFATDPGEKLKPPRPQAEQPPAPAPQPPPEKVEEPEEAEEDSRPANPPPAAAPYRGPLPEGGVRRGLGVPERDMGFRPRQQG